MQRYIKQVNGKWYDVYVEFDEKTQMGNVVNVKITDEIPDMGEYELIYAQQ